MAPCAPVLQFARANKIAPFPQLESTTVDDDPLDLSGKFICIAVAAIHNVAQRAFKTPDAITSDLLYSPHHVPYSPHHVPR